MWLHFTMRDLMWAGASSLGKGEPRTIHGWSQAGPPGLDEPRSPTPGTTPNVLLREAVYVLRYYCPRPKGFKAKTLELAPWVELHSLSKSNIKFDLRGLLSLSALKWRRSATPSPGSHRRGWS